MRSSQEPESTGESGPDSAVDGDRAGLDACIEFLEAVVRDRAILARLSESDRTRLLKAAGLVARPDLAARRRLSRARRQLARDARRDADEARLARTGIRELRSLPRYPTPKLSSPEDTSPRKAPPEDHYLEGERLLEPRTCYVCKEPFRVLHHFYDSLCPGCAAFNWTKRHQTADLSGRVALVTGGRVKIGYQAAIKLLRAGADVIVTTRFPGDAARRFSAEDDFSSFGERLSIFGLDLRHTPSVEEFCRFLNRTRPRLDFLLNNACQTVRRPPRFYAHMMDVEARSLSAVEPRARRLLASYEELCAGRRAAAEPALRPRSEKELAGLLRSAELSQVPLLPDDVRADVELFPDGRLDADSQQVDLRDKNSWRLKLAEVSSVELLEVHLVNAVAPFVLCARLKPLMLRQRTFDKHIVNVSAMEGQFRRSFKTDKHPHTNMAKAALNMLTRTSAPDYARDGIYMNSVDTGWITDEDPVVHQRRKREEHRFHPPLDIVDAAARICDPIFDGISTGNHVYGRFLKDYRPVDW